jgi:hypothetical protein
LRRIGNQGNAAALKNPKHEQVDQEPAIGIHREPAVRVSSASLKRSTSFNVLAGKEGTYAIGAACPLSAI